jgi:hypothetical protein
MLISYTQISVPLNVMNTFASRPPPPKKKGLKMNFHPRDILLQRNEIVRQTVPEKTRPIRA